MKHIFFGLSFICIVLLFAISCKNGNNSADQALSADIVNNPNTSNGDSDTSKLPKFSFSEDVHDFGQIIQGEKVSFSYKFKNVGKSDMIITDAKGSCGCTVADYPKIPIKPNGEGTIDVTFNSEGKKGFQNKTITIVANTQPSTKILTIKVNIKVPEEEK
ncbi:MAG: DUF1573 domain-containing protein [Bacteroidetes bacterium]|nr:DUF1573 domain-containing protein [Bacteroidota bacterium]